MRQIPNFAEYHWHAVNEWWCHSYLLGLEVAWWWALHHFSFQAAPTGKRAVFNQEHNSVCALSSMQFGRKIIIRNAVNYA
jgi:hypothetical protein